VPAGVVVVVEAQGDLLEVVLALAPGGRLPDLLHRREQQADEDRDDGDHDQQLDQGEASAGRLAGFHGTPSGEMRGNGSECRTTVRDSPAPAGSGRGR
jgi:hypothetical protein